MSYKLAKLSQAAMLKRGPKKPRLTRVELLALAPHPVYDDGQTKQCFADECNIEKIMARFDVTQTISHVNKHQGSYADFSDYDFHESTRMLTRGREIFDELPAELRQEFGQSPAAFFAHVNDPENQKLENYGLKALAKPGRQLSPAELPSADLASREAAKQSVDLEPASTPNTPPAPSEAS